MVVPIATVLPRAPDIALYNLVMTGLTPDVHKHVDVHAGYSLNALVDFPTSDPIEIIKRLMIGSEGTFGFVSRATYNTVPEWPNKVIEAASRGAKPSAVTSWASCQISALSKQHSLTVSCSKHC
jgi:FAD/FMN-containing dehydrogenase